MTYAWWVCFGVEVRMRVRASVGARMATNGVWVGAGLRTGNGIGAGISFTD